MNDIVSDIVKSGLLDEVASHQVQDSIAQGRSLYDALIGADVPVDQTLQYLSKVFCTPLIALDQHELTKEFLSQFPARILLDKHVLPLSDSGTMLAVVGNPFDTAGVDELRLATGQDFTVALAPITDIDRCLKRHLGVGADSVQSMISDAQDSGLKIIDQDTDEDMDLTASADEAPIIRFVNQILTEAIELRATDVHIEPFEGE